MEKFAISERIHCEVCDQRLKAPTTSADEAFLTLLKYGPQTTHKETFTQDHTPEALLHICHFLWTQSNLGNMQQTQSRRKCTD